MFLKCGAPFVMMDDGPPVVRGFEGRSARACVRARARFDEGARAGGVRGDVRASSEEEGAEIISTLTVSNVNRPRAGEKRRPAVGVTDFDPRAWLEGRAVFCY